MIAGALNFLLALTVRNWSELRLSSGSRARAEILCNLSILIPFAHMRETQSFIKRSKKPQQTKQNATPQTCMPVEINSSLN